MANPGVMGGLGIAGSAAGGILGAIGALNTGAANSAMYQYKAGVAQINQQISTQNQQWSLQSGGIAGEEKGLQEGQTIASTKVSQAAGDLDVNSGSDAATRGSQTKAAQFDQQTIQWNAQKQAYGYATKAAEAGAEATMDTQAASGAKQAGILGAVSSIIGGVTSVASKWTQGKNIGLTPGSNNTGVGTFDPSNYGAAPTWSG